MKYWIFEKMNINNIESLKYWIFEILNIWNIGYLKYWISEISHIWNIEYFLGIGCWILNIWNTEVLEKKSTEKKMKYPIANSFKPFQWICCSSKNLIIHIGMGYVENKE